MRWRRNSNWILSLQNPKNAFFLKNVAFELAIHPNAQLLIKHHASSDSAISRLGRGLVDRGLPDDTPTQACCTCPPPGRPPKDFLFIKKAAYHSGRTRPNTTASRIVPIRGVVLSVVAKRPQSPGTAALLIVLPSSCTPANGFSHYLAEA